MSFDKTGLCCSLNLTTEELEAAIQRTGLPAHWIDRQHEDVESDLMDFEMNMLRIQNGGQAWAKDDVSGAILDADMVKEARIK